MKGIVIAGTGSGVGKTSITTGLLSRLSKTMRVQAYKIGPDFIDPMYHTVATGRHARNLDSFLMTEDRIKNLVGYSAKDADICVVEGVRGLYEGLSGESDECSTAEMAKMLGFPVILVVNARSLTRSAAAIIRGFQSFDEDVNIAGVILNNVSGIQHETKLLDAIKKYTDVNVIGIVKRDMDNAIGQRHLGLNTIDRSEKKNIDYLGSMVSELDLDQIMDICESNTVDDLPDGLPYVERNTGLKAAIPLDDAFCFYYYENIECLKTSGMDISFFKPTCGDRLPNADLYYLGGGYPELHADDISQNTDFLEGLKTESEDGKMILGECGGLMSMCSSIKASDGIKNKMSGIFEADAKMSDRHGPSYVIARTTSVNPLFPDMTVRAHEFHYSELELYSDRPYGYDIIRGTGIDGKHDGLIYKNSLGSYMHQHALSTDDWLAKIVDRIL
ncbi:MAG: cobyrinate a,c-diamide synthase [Candidatus Methanomethylophilaceae archaeon]|jgi:cobyrinic acid a,c-diamide synthase